MTRQSNETEQPEDCPDCGWNGGSHGPWCPTDADCFPPDKASD